jgi:hypothetical protein
MTKEFIPYQEALALKQLGFDEPCFGLWNINNGKYEVDIIGVCKYSEEFKYREVLAPTYQQAFRWFREKYNLFGQVNIRTYYIYEISNDGIAIKMASQYDKLLNTYEEAELECLKKLIELIKQKQL